MFASLFEEYQDACATDAILCNDIFDEYAIVISVHDSFSQVDQIRLGYGIPP